VQLPKSLKEAFTYGLLVGSVVFGVFSLVSVVINKWKYKVVFVTTIFGMITVCLASVINWMIFH